MAIDIEVLREPAAVIRGRREEFHERFYRILRERHPVLEQSLDGDKRQSTRRIFDGGMEALLAYFDDPDQLEQAIRQLAFDEVLGSFEPEYLEVFGFVCLEALAELFEDRWSKELEITLDDAICLVGAILQRTMLDHDSPPKRAKAIVDSLS